MKHGDVITVLGPHGTVITGTVTEIEQMRTRADGWWVTISISAVIGEASPVPNGFVLRLDGEGCKWIYGSDQKSIDGLRVANALSDQTRRIPRPRASKPFLRRKGTL